MRSRRGFGLYSLHPALASVFLAVLLANAPSLACGDSIAFGGEIQQGLSGAVRFTEGASTALGAATSIRFRFRSDNESVTIRASGKLSLLYGNDAKNLWVLVSLNPSRSIGSFMNPAYSPSASTPEFITMMSISELSLTWSNANLLFEAGLAKTNWGLGKAFSPSDFFADFDYSSGTPERKPRLLAQASWFPNATTRLDFVADPTSQDGATLASRLYGLMFGTLAGGASVGIRAAANADPLRLLAACELIFDLPYLSPYGELRAVIPLDGTKLPSISALGGMTTRVGNAVIVGEYLYAQNETIQHKFFALASLSINEWTSLSLPAYYFPETSAFTSGIVLTLNDLAGITLSLSGSLAKSPSDPWTGALGLMAGTAF